MTSAAAAIAAKTSCTEAELLLFFRFERDQSSTGKDGGENCCSLEGQHEEEELLACNSSTRGPEGTFTLAGTEASDYEAEECQAPQ
jgi:hypothetical protein